MSRAGLLVELLTWQTLVFVNHYVSWGISLLVWTDYIEHGIEVSAVSTTQAKLQLSKASKSGNSKTSWVSGKLHLSLELDWWFDPENIEKTDFWWLFSLNALRYTKYNDNLLIRLSQKLILLSYVCQLEKWRGGKIEAHLMPNIWRVREKGSMGTSFSRNKSWFINV